MSLSDPQVIAEVCHEANRVIQRHLGEEVNVVWEDLDEETRDSAIDGVANAMGGATPRESHENWLRFKGEHGWTYGEVKDFSAKTHPCFVPYDELPVEQKVKDALFTNIVRALM